MADLTALDVLVGCETSGEVREAFRRRGHNATSCDLLPADDGSNHHIVCDVRDAIASRRWDLIFIAHPPCTRLCRAGGHWLFGKDKSHPKKLPKGRTWDDMKAEFDDGVDLFTACWRADCPHVAIENPVMHKHAVERMPADLPKPQTVQPWWFGEPAFKATGLYLRGLPALQATNRLTPPKHGTDEYKRWAVIHRASPSPDRWKLRSKTFRGLAEAVADQFGQHVVQQMAGHAG